MPYLLRNSIGRALRFFIIVLLSACTTIHPETISTNLAPDELERFQSDYTDCRQYAESQRPKASFRDDFLFPITLGLALVSIGTAIEYGIHSNAHPNSDPYHGGKVIIGFSIAGAVLASGLVVGGMISRQNKEDAAMRTCLRQRGYAVAGDNDE